MDDNQGRVEHPNWLLDGYRAAVRDCLLIDLNLEGYPFTWAKSKGKDDEVEERLDRALCTQSWLTMFPQATLTNLVAAMSDHSPTGLNLHGADIIHVQRRFRFENAWLKEEELHSVVHDSWSRGCPNDVLGKFVTCTEDLAEWDRNLRTKFRRAIERCKRVIDSLSYYHDVESERLLAVAKSRLGVLLMQEEDFWRQRAKVHWLKEGDRNTKFFHAMATQRKRRNVVRQLENDAGVVIDDQSGKCEMAKSYFTTLFTGDQCNYDLVLAVINSRVTTADNSLLCVPFTHAEVMKALFHMHHDKSPGPDGLNAAFYQRF